MNEAPFLSICIPTLNRGRFIGETLDSIVGQLTSDIEVVIVDGGSTDNTAEIVRRYTDRFRTIRYIVREKLGAAPSNEGFDRDCDYAVELARGCYCWLFTDDDVIAPGALRTVVDELTNRDLDLLLVDSEVRDMHLRRIYEPRRLRFTGRRDYSPGDSDQFMMDSGDLLTFVGGVIIRRASWLERDRASFYGSGFVHVGVIYQRPQLESVRILGQSLVQIRKGNAAWNTRAFDIWMTHWPNLIWSFAGYSDKAKTQVIAREPWRKLRLLLICRANGSFRKLQYSQLAGRASAPHRVLSATILALPGPAAHFVTVLLMSFTRYRRTSGLYDLLVASPHSNPLSRAIGKLLGHSTRPLPAKP